MNVCIRSVEYFQLSLCISFKDRSHLLFLYFLFRCLLLEDIIHLEHGRKPVQAPQEVLKSPKSTSLTLSSNESLMRGFHSQTISNNMFESTCVHAISITGNSGLSIFHVRHPGLSIFAIWLAHFALNLVNFWVIYRKTVCGHIFLTYPCANLTVGSLPISSCIFIWPFPVTSQ